MFNSISAKLPECKASIAFCVTSVVASSREIDGVGAGVVFDNLCDLLRVEPIVGESVDVAVLSVLDFLGDLLFVCFSRCNSKSASTSLLKSSDEVGSSPSSVTVSLRILSSKKTLFHEIVFFLRGILHRLKKPTFFICSCDT